jgi:drug/metabolite transporter (DMT)-like permease
MGSGLSVFNLSFWRFFVSFLFLLAVFICQQHKNLSSLREHAKAFVCGALFYSAPSTLFFIASQYIGTGQSMVIFFSFPAFVMVLNRFFFGHAIKRQFVISFALIVAGLVLLIDMKDISFDMVGIGLSLLSAVSYAFYIVFGKSIKLAPLNSTMMVSLGCALMSLLLAFFDNSLAMPVKSSQWLNLLGLALICTAIPILLMLESLRHISSSRASLLAVLEPVFT